MNITVALMVEAEVVGVVGDHMAHRSSNLCRRKPTYIGNKHLPIYVNISLLLKKNSNLNVEPCMTRILMMR